MAKDKDEIKESIFKIAQTFLKNHPLIVWGSGATISFDLPSMWNLNEALKKSIDGFDISNKNLEIELGKEKYKSQMPEIKKIIWNETYKADIAVLERIIKNKSDDFIGITKLIEWVIESHPRTLNIVTTNYDRVLEYIMSFQGIAFTDGFEGKALSIFNENLFQEENIVNLIKVHGSLSWFDVDGEIRFLNSNPEHHQPQIIAPSKNKYQETYHSPYRELIQKADNVIKKASSFLVVGFGFNDEHLTPRIRTQIKKGIPIVIITKTISESAFKELESAKRYLLLEEFDDKKTKIIYKNGSSEEKQEEVLEGQFWQLTKFMEIL
jgi:hypothetical protein